MERRCKSQQQQIFDLKQELTNSTAELKLRLAQTEGSTHTHMNHRSLYYRECHFFYFPVYQPLTERLEIEKRRSKQALEDMDSLRQKEVAFLCYTHRRPLVAT